jgi:hypothetical protein
MSEDMLLAGKIVEKGPFADIRRVGNVFYGGRDNLSLAEKL